MVPSVSVVIPCYNVASCIDECLDSVEAQTCGALEIICVDNNSRDGTFARLEARGAANSALRALKEPAPGAGAARNCGLASAKGEWVQFLDADDLLLPEKIAHQLDLLRGATPAFLAGASYYENTKKEREVRSPESDPWKGIFFCRFGNTCANLWRTGALRAVGGWDDGLKSSQETDLMFRLLRNVPDPPMVDPVPLTVVREREAGQISSADPAANLERFVALRAEILQVLERENPGWHADHEAACRQFIFDKIHSLAAWDLERAARLHDTHLKGDFAPGLSGCVTRGYAACFRLGGFRFAERTARLVRRLRPRA
jgi:glycosyltransferase involved in cell wall biosynthesis